MEIATALIDRGADLNAKDQNGQTPLHTVATVMFSRRIANKLIDRGGDVDAKDQTGRTPLYYAVCGGRTEIASLLIARGANVTKRMAYLAGGHSEMAYLIKVADFTSLLTVRSSGDADLGGQEQECKRSRIKI
jgi:ankyrin repeat protein